VSAPVSIYVEVDLQRRVTPVSQLQKALKEFQSSDVDYSIRREGVILQPPDGQIIAFGAGHVVFRFRGKPLEETFKWVEDVLGKIFEAFNLDEKAEPLSLSLDAFYVVPSKHDPVDFLKSKEILEKFTALLNNIRGEVGTGRLDFYGQGVVLFLTPLEDEDMRVQLRVEPAFSEPHSKFFVDFSYSRKSLVLEDINMLLKEVNKYEAAIFRSLGGGGAEA